MILVHRKHVGTKRNAYWYAIMSSNGYWYAIFKQTYMHAHIPSPSDELLISTWYYVLLGCYRSPWLPPYSIHCHPDTFAVFVHKTVTGMIAFVVVVIVVIFNRRTGREVSHGTRQT